MGNFKSRKGRRKTDSLDNSKPFYHGPRPSLASHEVKLVNEGVSYITTSFPPFLKNREEKLENWAFAPFTLSSCFSMIKVGTIGQTSAEIDRALNFPVDVGSHCKGHREIFKSFAPIQSTKEFTIISVHRLYLDRKFNITDSYKILLEDTFNSSIEQLDFSSSSSPSEVAIEIASYMNEWIEESTQGKIKDIISPQDLTSTVKPRLILLSGVYFIGLWEWEFQTSEHLNFYLSDKPGDFILVEMMIRDAAPGSFVYVAYLKDFDTDVIGLPYIGQRYWMFIFLPRKSGSGGGGGLDKIEQNIKNLPKPSSIFKEMKRDVYILTLPKFQIECTLDLVESLLKLGVRKLFGGSEIPNTRNGAGTGSASGSGGETSTRTDSLVVSKALQKVLITVDKRGTEPSRFTVKNVSTNATALVQVPAQVQAQPPDEKPKEKEKEKENQPLPPAPPPPPRVSFASPEQIKLEQKKFPEIHVNHPFYFQIIDKDFDMIFFAGCCGRPPAIVVSSNLRKMSTVSRSKSERGMRKKSK